MFSNAAFQILSYALENITGRTFKSILADDIFRPLKMTSSSLSTPPTTSQAVVPGDETATGWSVDLGDEAAYVPLPLFIDIA